jgi:hypothetical protein
MRPLWVLCVIVRLSIIFIIRYLYKFKKNKLYKVIPSIILLLMGLGFTRKGIVGSNNEIQIAKVFWHETRLVHGMLYIFASYYLYIGNLNMNSIILFTDLLFSFTYRIVNQV